jgi:glycosyltransferase involved in cell wall biosynthesis
MTDRKKILLFADWYEPGYKAGGPIRSCVNFVRQMQPDYRIYVFTSDRDLGSSFPYHDVKTDEWLAGKGDSEIYYSSPVNLSWQNIRRQIDVIRPDFIYLNSMFSPKFTIYPLLVNRLHQRHPVILSPRGMLRESAIRFKTAKKRLFLHGLRALGLHRAIHFHATDATEMQDIRRYFGNSSRVSMIANFPGAPVEDRPAPVKRAGDLSLIFIGRIHPIKNLHLLLGILTGVQTTVRLTVVGNLEDEAYWEKCKKIIAELPPHIHVEYVGEIANDELPGIIARHHIFALPTRGENFGHAIFEALAVGKPVLISDQTPWRNLQLAGAGWDLPLDRPAGFREIIELTGGWGQQEYEKCCGSTRQYLKDYLSSLNLKQEYNKLFS